MSLPRADWPVVILAAAMGSGAAPAALAQAPTTTLTSSDGRLTIELPADVPTGFVPTLEVLPGEGVPGPDGSPPTDSYRLGPEGATFTTPVRVTLRLPPAADGSVEQAVLQTVDADGVSQTLADARIVASADEVLVSGTTTHFSEMRLSGVYISMETEPYRMEGVVDGPPVELALSLHSSLSSSFRFVPGQGGSSGSVPTGYEVVPGPPAGPDEDWYRRVFRFICRQPGTYRVALAASVEVYPDHFRQFPPPPPIKQGEVLTIANQTEPELSCRAPTGAERFAPLFDSITNADPALAGAVAGAYAPATPPLDRPFVPGAGEKAGLDLLTIDGGAMVRAALPAAAVRELLDGCTASAPPMLVKCSDFALDPTEESIPADVLLVHVSTTDDCGASVAPELATCSAPLDNLPEDIYLAFVVNVDEDGRSRNDFRPRKGFPFDWLSCGDHSLWASPRSDAPGVAYTDLGTFKPRPVEAFYVFLPDAIWVIVLHPAPRARYLPLLELTRDGGQTAADIGTASWGYTPNDGSDRTCRMPYARVTPVTAGMAAP